MGKHGGELNFSPLISRAECKRSVSQGRSVFPAVDMIGVVRKILLWNKKFLALVKREHNKAEITLSNMGRCDALSLSSLCDETVHV